MSDPIILTELEDDLSGMPLDADFDAMAREACESGRTSYSGPLDEMGTAFLFHELGHKLTTYDHREHAHLPLSAAVHAGTLELRTADAPKSD